jgi:hypothetical protein
VTPEAGSDRVSPLRYVAALAAVLVSPVAFRLLLVWERTGGFELQDLRGLVSDAAVSLVALALLVALGRRLRVLAALALAVWCIAQYANYEIVSALGSLASFSDAGYLLDPTFVVGSALVVSRPVTLTVLLVVSLALGHIGILSLRPRAAVGSLAAAALLVGLYSAWPWSHEFAIWRQTHFLQYDARRVALDVLEPESSRLRFRDAPAAMLDLLPELAADLSGAPRLPLEGRKRNVLLVILESVSGLHLESLAADHDLGFTSLMPQLDAIARDNLSYSTFFVHQRRTNKGLYALLCGELPNLVAALPKMSAYVEGGRVCLPEALRREGYHTVYLQAAPLAFMLKDQFMPRAGFEQVHGYDWFTGGYARSTWGVDDRAFLEQSLEMIRSLNRDGRPWFLTLLTVGTHHPYVVPEEYQPQVVSRVGRALRYADEAVGEFDRRLDELGISEDTLVLYTSDESLGFDGTIKKLDQLILKSWGLLIARPPEGTRARVREPFAQMDLAISVLDYLGLAHRGGHFFGRSVFRSYEQRRHVFFANSNSDFNGALHPHGRLALCMLDFESCRAYAVPEGRVFGRQRRPLTWDPELDGIVQEMALRSVNPIHVESDLREFQLLEDPVFVVNQTGLTIVHGGQYVTLDEGDWIEVEFEVEARGGEGRVRLLHRLQYPRYRPYEDSAELRAGEVLHWRYSFAPEEPLQDVTCRSRVRLLEGPGLELHFKTARMTLHRSGEPSGSGVQVERLEVVAAP